LQRAARSENRDLLDATGAENFDRVVGGIGDCQLRGRKCEHPRDVDGDVAGADHDHLAGLQIDLKVGVVGVAVVPGNELRRRVRAGELLTRDREPFVDRGAERVEDDVVVVEELPAGDVAAELDVPEEPETLMLGRSVVGPRDRLDLRMVRSHPRPDHSVRRRKAVVWVDGERWIVDGEELAGGVEAARAGTDDRGSEGGDCRSSCSRRGTLDRESRLPQSAELTSVYQY
jgi:hypothetical protein